MHDNTTQALQDWPTALIDTAQCAGLIGIAKRTLENKRVSGINPIPYDIPPGDSVGPG
jgi:hypothetical protein